MFGRDGKTDRMSCLELCVGCGKNMLVLWKWWLFKPYIEREVAMSAPCLRNVKKTLQRKHKSTNSVYIRYCSYEAIFHCNNFYICMQLKSINLLHQNLFIR